MKKSKLFVLGLTGILGLSLCSTSVFAATVQNYGIDWNGGSNLGSGNVTINQNLIKDLGKTLVNNGLKVTSPTGSGWSEGFISYGGSCHPVKYFTVDSGNHSVDSSYVISGKPNSSSNREYQITVNIKNINFDIGSTTETSKKVAVAISVNDTDVWNGNIAGGWRVYETEAKCKAGTDFVVGGLALKQNEHLFVNTNIKLTYKDENDKGKIKTLNSDQLYFELTDIDGAQAYKIQTPANNRFSKSNMFAASAGALQPTASTATGDISLKNKFVTSNDGNYIYSDYNKNCTASSGADCQFDIKSGSNVYVKLDKQAQDDGIGMVFGFTIGAGSNVRYFAKQLKVNYNSDKNGKIADECITSEEVVSGNNPFGSCSIPNEDYEFVYWIADKDVILNDETVIKRGEKLTPEQVKQVIVTEEITFTAIHTPIEEPVIAPDTGASTTETNAMYITISLAGVLLSALSIRLMPRFLHRKVKFD